MTEVSALVLFAWLIFKDFDFFAEDGSGGIEEAVRLSVGSGGRVGLAPRRGLYFLSIEGSERGSVGRPCESVRVDLTAVAHTLLTYWPGASGINEDRKF